MNSFEKQSILIFAHHSAVLHTQKVIIQVSDDKRDSNVLKCKAE